MAYGKVRVDQVQSSTRTVDVDSLATTAVATQSVAGLLSATDKTKLDGVATGAEVNVNADWSAGRRDRRMTRPRPGRVTQPGRRRSNVQDRPSWAIELSR